MVDGRWLMVDGLRGILHQPSTIDHWRSADLAERHFAGGDPPITIDVPDEVPLDETTALALYRGAQEAFTNIARHANAKKVWLTLVMLPDEVRLQVEDDGIGLDEAKLRHSFGLRGMHERMKLLGGRTTISSAPEERDKGVHIGADQVTRPNGIRYKVLIADDHKIVAEGIARRSTHVTSS